MASAQLILVRRVRPVQWTAVVLVSQLEQLLELCLLLFLYQ